MTGVSSRRCGRGGFPFFSRCEILHGVPLGRGRDLESVVLGMFQGILMVQGLKLACLLLQFPQG